MVLDFLAAGVAARMRRFSADEQRESFAALQEICDEAFFQEDFDVWVPARQLVGEHARDQFTVAVWPFASESECRVFIRDSPLAGEGFRAMRLRECPPSFAAQEPAIRNKMRAVRWSEEFHQVLDARKPRAPGESAEITPPRP